MKRRNVEILLNLLGQKKKMNIDKLSEKYQVSSRTLKKDIKGINSFLESIHQERIQVDQKGNLKLAQACDYNLIRDELFKIDMYRYKMSQEERCIYIIVLLAIQKDYITMEKIAEELFVSRITIISDMEIVKNMLREYDVLLISRSSKGLLLSYKEEHFRLLLVKLFRNIIINVRSEGYFQRLMIQKMSMKFPFANFVKLLRHFEIKYKITFSEQIFYENALFLFISCNRIAEGALVEVSLEVSDNYAKDLLYYISEKVEMKIPKEEISFYGKYIDEKKLLPITKSNKDVEFSDIIRYFLSKMGKSLMMHFQEDHLLVESLLMHINTMENMTTMDISFEDEAVPIAYQELLFDVKQNAYILEKYLNRSLTETMVTSIVIHICASLIRNRTFIEKLSVLIVCPGSVATGKLLEAQVKNYFDFHIEGIVSVSQITQELEIQNKQVDFVISTVFLLNLNCPVITVNPVLEIEDINLIQKQALMMGRKEKPISANKKKKQELQAKLEDAIKQFKDNDDTDRVLDELEAAIQTYRLWEQKKNANIEIMMDATYIKIQKEVISWQKALREVGSIMENINYGFEYVNQIVENVKEYGPYIVISPGVAIAHAGVDYGVYKDGLSLLVSKEGILFEDDIKVHLLFCFCTTDEVEYLSLLKEIVEIGKSGKAERISGLSTKEEIYDELIK